MRDREASMSGVGLFLQQAQDEAVYRGQDKEAKLASVPYDEKGYIKNLA